MAEGHRPAKGLSTAERLALREAKKANGGIPTSEIAVPVEVPMSEPVAAQEASLENTKTKEEIVGATVVEMFAKAKLLKERKNKQTAEVPPVAAAEPVVESVPQEPAPTEAVAPVVEPVVESGAPESLVQESEERQTIRGIPPAPETPVAAKKETKEIPPELAAIYGDKVPRVVSETFEKIKNKETMEDFLKQKVAEVAEENRKAAELAERKQKFAEQAHGKGNKKNKKQNPTKKPAQAATPEATPTAEPVPEIPPIAQALEGLEQEAIDQNIAVAHAGDTSLAEGEPLPSVSHSNRRAKSGGEEGVPIMLDSEDIPEEIRRSLEAGETRAGWVSQIRSLVGKFGEGVSERFTKSKNYLNERAKELDAKAEMSGLEKWTRNIGERYNKLSPIHKLGIGVTLGVGTAVGAAFSLPLALTGMSGLALQRAVGAAGMFVSIEKKLQEKKVGETQQWMAVKERAALDALLYTVVMGTAISKGLELVRDYDVVERTREWWLGEKLDHPMTAPEVVPAKAETIPVTPSQELPPSVRVFSGDARTIDTMMAQRDTATLATAEVHEPAAAAAAGEVAAPVAEMPSVAATPAAPELPSAVSEIEVKATPGKGSEYMMKQLWKELHEKGVTLPDKANPDSDLVKLINADEEDIDALVHKIASDPKHPFFRPDGSSVRIDLDSKMTIDTHGELHLSPEKYDYTFVPAHAPVTPAPHIEVPTPVSEVSVSPSEVPIEAPVAPITPVPEMPPLQEVLPEQTPMQTIDVPERVERPPESIDTGAQPEAPSVSAPEAQTTSAYETSSSNEVSPPDNHERTIISNVHNVQIQTAEAHIYGDKHPGLRFVYGGDEKQQMKMMKDYLNKVKYTSTATVYAEDANGHRVPWTLNEAGDLIKGPPVRYGFWNSFEEPPNPEKFTKLFDNP